MYKALYFTTSIIGSTLITSSMFAGSFVKPKPEAFNCKDVATIGYQLAKDKSYTKAEKSLEKVRKECPEYSMGTYQYLERVYKHKLYDATSLSDKQKVAKELVELYKERLSYFPKKTHKGMIYAKIGSLMKDNQLGNAKEQFSYFSKAFKEDAAHVKKASHMYTYYQVAKELGKDKDVQAKLVKHITALKQSYESQLSTLTAVSQKTKKQQKKIKNIKGYLEDYDQTLAVVYPKKVAEQYVENRKSTTQVPVKKAPNFNEVYAMAKKAPSKKQAIAYYKQAIELSSKNKNKAGISYEIASLYQKQGHYAKAKSYYKKALAYDASLGRAYLEIASMIANTPDKCGKTPFEKRAVYWLAANYADKAAKADKSIRSIAKQTKQVYLAKAPSRSDIFNNPDQKKVKIPCWINETVSVPKL